MADESAERLRIALATQAATRARLRVLQGGGTRWWGSPTCARARAVAYRRSDVEHDIVDQWYLASQLWADAVLLSAIESGIVERGDHALAGWDEAEALCHLEKGFAFLDCFWGVGGGGYCPRSDLSGAGGEVGIRYCDDNALAGLTLLAAAEALPDESSRRRLLDAARREADFLMEGGLWDETFDGGFWWNLGRGDTEEGKPAQANALAALFFGRLYERSRDETYREWALRTLDWLDTALYDPARRLYRWSMRYEDPPGRVGVVRSERYFNYDQAIALEAQIVASRLDRGADRLARARDVGRALHEAFWNAERGGYNLEAGVEQVFTSYGAWTSLGHLALYDVDGDPSWLDLARANADALDAALREPDGGYAYRHYLDAGRHVVDRSRDTAAQAWMQHLQVALTQRLTGSP
jgi:hypothetical protein